VFIGDDPEQHLAEALNRLLTGLTKCVGDAGPLRLGQLVFELAPLGCKVKQTLPAIARARGLDDESLADELAKNPI
jgi:hypothetical protein